MTPHIQLLRIQPGEKVLEDLAGMRYTIPFVAPSAEVETWQDLINWIKENPEIIMALIQAILTLLGGITPPPKKAA